MLITAFRSKFIFETLPIGFYVRLPFLGEGTWSRDPSWRVWSSWRELKALGQV